LVIPDSPANTRAIWLNKEERELAASRMHVAGTKTATMIDRRLLWKKIKLTATSPISWLFLAAYLQFAWSQRANSYFLLWLKVSYQAPQRRTTTDFTRA
jgi:ACS family pantothenate transporter-like MFS transporter